MSAPKLDAVAAAAVDEAREAAVETAGDMGVGAHLGAVAEDDRVVTHSFECPHPGYVGWYWAVTVVRANRARTVTVNEVVLLPGAGALLAPSWVPWAERMQASDLTPGMLMPPPQVDLRVMPGYTGGAEFEAEDPLMVRAVVQELGLGREWVLSDEGRAQAAERWLDGDGGPYTEAARLAPAPCGTCAFFVRLRGSLGVGFGACANQLSPSDGRVVASEHGCGAHSDVRPEAAEELPEPVWDTLTLEESLFD